MSADKYKLKYKKYKYKYKKYKYKYRVFTVATATTRSLAALLQIDGRSVDKYETKIWKSVDLGDQLLHQYLKYLVAMFNRVHPTPSSLYYCILIVDWNLHHPPLHLSCGQLSNVLVALPFGQTTVWRTNELWYTSATNYDTVVQLVQLAKYKCNLLCYTSATYYVTLVQLIMQVAKIQWRTKYCLLPHSVRVWMFYFP